MSRRTIYKGRYYRMSVKLKYIRVSSFMFIFVINMSKERKFFGTLFHNELDARTYILHECSEFIKIFLTQNETVVEIYYSVFFYVVEETVPIGF